MKILARSDGGMRARISGWGIYAMLGFVASAAVHIGTYVGHTMRPSTPMFFVLHFGFIPAVLAEALRSRAWEVGGSVSDQRWRRGDWRAWRPFLPAWATRAIYGLWAYWFATFLVSAFYLPHRSGGELTPTQAVYFVRVMSCGVAAVYGLYALFFTCVADVIARRSTPRQVAP